MPLESTTSGSGASTITSTTAPDSAIDKAVDKPTTTPTGPNRGSIAETRKRLALDNQPTGTTAGLAPATPGGSTPTVESRVDEIVRRIKGITGSGDEKRILAILSDADGVDLDTILARVDQRIGLHKLIDDIDDHRWPFGGKNQAALFTLLTEDRLADLSIRHTCCAGPGTSISPYREPRRARHSQYFHRHPRHRADRAQEPGRRGRRSA